jgi:hypothetical protein
MIVVAGKADLLEVVDALNAPRSLARRLDRRQQKSDENSDDGDHNQQLDQSKTAIAGMKTHLCLPFGNSTNDE